MAIPLPSVNSGSTEVSRIADQLHRAYRGPAWHGPSLKAILTEVTEDRAAIRPASGAHSIWEIVLHITAWLRIGRERLTAPEARIVSGEEDWPEPGRSWTETLAALETEERALEEAIHPLSRGTIAGARTGRGTANALRAAAWRCTAHPVSCATRSIVLNK